MAIFWDVPSHEDRVHLHVCTDCGDVWLCSRRGCQPARRADQCGLCADQQFNDYVNAGRCVRPPQEMSK